MKEFKVGDFVRVKDGNGFWSGLYGYVKCVSDGIIIENQNGKLKQFDRVQLELVK